MSEQTPNAVPDRTSADETSADETRADEARDRREDDELAPEEELLEGWLPEATPTEGPAPAP